jgi:hypothetical protein
MSPSSPEHDWVLAAPFRAHLRHLQAATGLPWAVLARAAGVSPSLVHHLVHGRNGRHQRRISRDSARRLIAVDRARLAGLGLEWVPADRTRRQVRRLLADGADPGRLAAWCRVSRPELLGLTSATRCNRLVALLVDAACPPGLLASLDRSSGREAA